MNRGRACRLASVAFVLVALVVISAAVAAAVERPPVAPLAPAGSPGSYFQRTTLQDYARFGSLGHAASDFARGRVYLPAAMGVFIVDMDSAARIGQLGASAHYGDVALNPDGSRAFVHRYGYDSVTVYNTSTQAQIASYGVGYSLRSMVASGRGRLYASQNTFSPYQAYVYDAATGAELAKIPQPGGVERTGAFLAAHGDRLYTALNDEGDSDFMTLAVYDISGVTPVMVDSERYAGRIADLQVSPDGRFLVTLGGDYGGVDQYATADLSHMAFLDPRADGATVSAYIDIGISGDSRLIHLVTYPVNGPGVPANQVHSYDSDSHELERRLDNYDHNVECFTPLKGEQFLMAASSTLHFYAPLNGRAMLPNLTYNYCRSYFSDDFSNPRSGWPVSDSDAVRYAYENGQYRILFHDKEIWSGLTRGDVWNDSRLLGIEGHIFDGSGWWGLIFFIKDDWSHFYTVEINPHLQMYISTEYSDATGWTLLHYGESAAIRPGGAWNRLEVKEIDDVTFGVTVNGAYLGHTFPEGVGLMGLTASSLERDTDFRFDNYVFSAKNCPIPGETPSAQSVEPPVEMSRPPMLEGGR